MLNGTGSCFCFSVFLHNSFVLLFLQYLAACAAFLICNILQLVFSIGHSNTISDLQHLGTLGSSWHPPGCHSFSLPCLLTQGTDDVFCEVTCLNPICSMLLTQQTRFLRFDSSDVTWHHLILATAAFGFHTLQMSTSSKSPNSTLLSKFSCQQHPKLFLFTSLLESLRIIIILILKFPPAMVVPSTVNRVKSSGGRLLSPSPTSSCSFLASPTNQRSRGTAVELGVANQC